MEHAASIGRAIDGYGDKLEAINRKVTHLSTQLKDRSLHILDPRKPRAWIQ